MPLHLHLDFESFSLANLKDVGAYRYAFDPSTEILCAGMSLGESKDIYIWSVLRGFELLPDVFTKAFLNSEVLIYAHNAMMEMAMCQALLQKTWGIPCPALSRFRCTASLARRAALPHKLETLMQVLNGEQKKDPRGKALIRKFSMMQPGKKPSRKKPQGCPPVRIRPEDDPLAFGEFMEYCRQDVRAEQEVARRLAYFDEPINNANYSLDAVINARGVTVNLGALEHAQILIGEETKVVSDKFRKITGFEVTQSAKLRMWANTRGSEFQNLQAETIDTFLDKYTCLPEGVSELVDAIRLKQSVAFASIKKVQTMLDCAGPHDNRIRGMLNYHGATTGRWTASLVQFQNMKRSTLANSGDAFLDICAGMSREMLELTYGPVLEVLSSCIRHFVQGPFVDADYSAIEARIVNWLAGQEDALEEYRQGVERYIRMASFIYGISESEVNKFPQRFLGKTTILGCGFQMGPPKFRKSCKEKGYDLPPGLEEIAVKSFRVKHKKVVQYWYLVEKLAKEAILRPTEVFATPAPLPKVRFFCKNVEGIQFLFIQLPSGRKLAYPRPRIVDNRITFFGQRVGVNWGEVDTYGGKLVENITQAVAADIMAHGAHTAEIFGYEIATLIHDQALAYHQPNQTAENFVEKLTLLPPWATGLPLAAEGSIVPFYKKD